MAARHGRLSQSQHAGEVQPDLDAAVRDGECAKVIVLNRRELSFSEAITSERFNELVSIHQFHPIAAPEEARVICKDAASPQFHSITTPREDAFIVRRADDLQLKTVKCLLPLPIQHRHVHVQQTHQ